MKGRNRSIELGRRQFLRGGATATAVAVVAGAMPRSTDATPALARITYPSTKLVNIKALKIDEPVQIAYPDKDSPGVIIEVDPVCETARAAS
jgi:arsenite oxidase small subunit